MATEVLNDKKAFLYEFPWSATLEKELEALRKGPKVLVPPAYKMKPLDFSGEIEWSLWNNNLPGFQWWLNSFMFIRPLFSSKARTERDLNIAEHILKSWVESNPSSSPAAKYAWDGHATAIRAGHLASLYVLGCKDDWLLSALEEHALKLYDDEFHQGFWNHGLDQDIGLLSIGCAIDREDFTKKAAKRALDNFHHAVDDEGVSNEQAVGYQYYVFLRFSDLRVLLDACGMPMGKSETKRLERMHEFSAHSVTPQGKWAQIGDTLFVDAKKDATLLNRYAKNTPLEYAVSLGTKGSLPDREIAIYSAGYVFGRTGWGTTRSFDKESYYTIRFGPGRVVHGHNDHTSFTYIHEGERVLIDGGFHGYTDDAMRDHLRRPEAHNVLVCPDESKFFWDATTELVSENIKKDWQSYLLKDIPYSEATRIRSVAISFKSKLILVLDKMVSKKERRVQQVWNFDREYRIKNVESGMISLTSSKNKVALYQLWPHEGIEVRSGCESPKAGWAGYSRYEISQIPTVITSRKSKVSTFLTLFSFSEESEDLVIEQLPIKKDGVSRLVKVQSNEGELQFSIMEDDAIKVFDNSGGEVE